MKYRLGDDEVQTEGEDYWIAPNAAVMGKVRLKKNSSIWFGATLRGDNDWIEVGENTQIQDGSVLHTDPGYPLTIGADCTIGHMVMLHGCTIGAGSLIGIGAIILNGAKIGKNCLVGAKALVTEGKEFPDGSVIMGAPAKAVKQVTDAHLEMLEHIPPHYVERWKRFKRNLVPQD